MRSCCSGMAKQRHGNRVACLRGRGVRPEVSTVDIQWALRPRTLAMMLPHLEKARDEEWEDEAVQVELSNVVNEIRSILQHVEVGL